MQKTVNETLDFWELVKWSLAALWLGFTSLAMYVINKKVSMLDEHNDWLKRHEIEILELKNEQKINAQRDNETRLTIENYAKENKEMFKELISNQKAQSDLLNTFLRENEFVIKKLRNKELKNDD